MPVAAAAPHTTAVVTVLEAAEILVGRGIQPDGSGWQGEAGHSVFKGYTVLYPSSGLTGSGFADPTEYLDYRCQFTCVGATQTAAEGVADLVKALFVDRPLTVAGRSSYQGQLTLERPAARDDSVAPPVHFLVLQIDWRTQAD